ncbi:MAG: cytochrome C biogenesis protein CcmB [Herpetosiphonaceae bacterium]|nr:MAG: cytochrome C biogenesis protein CcmB [Herpetosiphonaceae bacterium]
MFSPSLWRSTWAILRKDLRAELRGRVAINTLLLFAITTVVLVSFRLGPLGISRDQRAVTSIAVLLWIAIFFAAMSGLSRSFVAEEEAGTAPLLRLAASPAAVFAGKLLYNLLLVAVLEALVVLLFAALMNLRVGNPGLFAASLAAGGVGLGVATTIIAALVARASVRGALFTVLAFPLLLPLLVVAVGATELALAGAGWSKAWPELRLLAAYVLALLAASLLLFEQVWEG